MSSMSLPFYMCSVSLFVLSVLVDLKGAVFSLSSSACVEILREINRIERGNVEWRMED